MDNGDGARLSVADRPHRGATVNQSHGDDGRGLGAPERSLDFRFLHSVGGLTIPYIRAGITARSVAIWTDTNLKCRKTDSSKQIRTAQKYYMWSEARWS